MIEHNSKIIKYYGQHGGGEYGSNIVCISEEIEKNYADKFFSYGLRVENVYPLFPNHLISIAIA